MSAPDLSGITGNFLTSAQKGFTDTLSASISDVDTTIAMNSLAGFADNDWILLWIEPGLANAELVYGQVDSATNSLTSVVRGVLGTAAVHANGASVGSFISSAHWMLIKKMLGIEHNSDGTHGAITADSIDVSGGITGGDIAGDSLTLGGTEILHKIYPVGSIYIETTGTNPNTTFGFGTWAAFGSGKMPIGVDSGNSSINASEKTGGTFDHKHQHTSPLGLISSTGVLFNPTDTHLDNPSGSTYSLQDIITANVGSAASFASQAVERHIVTSTANNPPYIAVYMWKRTA